MTMINATKPAGMMTRLRFHQGFRAPGAGGTAPLLGRLYGASPCVGCGGVGGRPDMSTHSDRGSASACFDRDWGGRLPPGNFVRFTRLRAGDVFLAGAPSSSQAPIWFAAPTRPTIKRMKAAQAIV